MRIRVYIFQLKKPAKQSVRIVMRNLQRGPRANSYNLIAINLQTKIKNSIIYDVELVSAAPILWHRRKEPF